MILITGLDGSGKSTMLNSLEADLKNKISILRVPTIEAEKFKGNMLLYRQCKCMNILGERADKEGLPSLKIVAMFGAMLLFKELHSELKKKGTIILCERHPLIDTAVYAKVYLKVMHPKHLDLHLGKQIEHQFSEELNELMSLIPEPLKRTGKGILYDLLQFLFDWFSLKENHSKEQLKALFQIDLPSFIYFLDAPSRILIQRLGMREVSEYHETEKLLGIMRLEYLKMFAEEETSIKVINTSKTPELDGLLEELKGNL